MGSNPWKLGYPGNKIEFELQIPFLSWALESHALLWSINKSSLIGWDCLALQILESLALVVKKKKKKAARLKTWKVSLSKS